MGTTGGNNAPSPAITFRRRLDRGVDELIGLCRGILADGEINQSEAEFLLDWLHRHREFSDSFPFNVLYGRVEAALSDGVLDQEERKDLLEKLHSVVGGEHWGVSASMATWAPFDNPSPVIKFPRNDFVLTGEFAIGPRFKMESIISMEGGYVKKSVTQSTRYLVIGTLGSRDWMHSSYGRKIEAAVALREEQSGLISIVSEECILDCLTPL